MISLVKKKGLKFIKKGFLEIEELQNPVQVMEWVLQEDVIDDLVWLCLIEDVYFNLNAVEIQ